MRGLRWNKPDIKDGKRLPTVNILATNSPVKFLKARNDVWLTFLTKSLVVNTKTEAFLVIRNDSLLFEHYTNKFDSSSLLNGFSMAKTVVGLLIGEAIHEGKITSNLTPFTKYLPEYLDYDSAFALVKIQHLLDMKSGISTKGDFSPIKAAKYYYGRNQKGKKAEAIVVSKPGIYFNYENLNTQILAWILEKVYNKKFTEIVEEKLWSKLNMESDATWIIDDKFHKDAKAYCCLSATARDFAKLGNLLLNHGKWNNLQVIDSNWIAQTINRDTLFKEEYKNQLWAWSQNYFVTDTLLSQNPYCKKYILKNSDGEISYKYECYNGDYSMQGLYGQFVYVNPAKRLIIVRLGYDHPQMFDLISKVEKIY